MSERNPYVMLGIPFGSSRDVATRAFARKAKGKRRQRGSTDQTSSLTDLTWALNQVVENIRDPRTALNVYRVPADPTAFEAPGEGVLRPGPELMPRVTPVTGEEWRRLLSAARSEAVVVLLEEIASSSGLPQR